MDVNNKLLQAEIEFWEQTITHCSKTLEDPVMERMQYALQLAQKKLRDSSNLWGQSKGTE